MGYRILLGLLGHFSQKLSRLAGYKWWISTLMFSHYTLLCGVLSKTFIASDFTVAAQWPVIVVV